ncbi:MAG: class I SAM-dependent methyltransferase [Gaiellaceae bacterium]
MEHDAWDDLFDELYLDTYVPRLEDRDAEDEALAAVRLAGLEPGADVLDAPCGFGRHAIPLARAGYRVTGVDRSPAQLDEARRRAGQAEWPRLLRADFRELPFADASFDGVLNLFTSIGYRGEAEDRRMLAEFRRVLRPGGALVIETLQRDRLVRIYQERRWDPLPGDSILIEEGRFDPVAGLNHATHTLITGGGERRSLEYTLRVYTPGEIVRMLDDCGFERPEAFGGWEGEALTTDTRLVLLARAPG